MKTIKNITLLLVMMLLVTMLISGCGGNSNNGAEKDADGTVTLTVTVNSTELGDIDLYEKYMAEHPGIKIEVVPMSNNDSKLLSMIASGNPPDVIRCMGYDELPVFVQRGILLPLDDYIAKSDNINLDNMYEVANLCRFEGAERGTGSLYALPKDWSPIGIWINKETFAEAGIELPSDTEAMTWEEFATLAKKLVKRDGEAVDRHGCITSLPLATLLEMYLNSYGSSLWTDDYSSTTLETKQTTAAVEFFMEMQKSAALASSLYPASDSVGQSALLEGKVGMVLSGYWFHGAYESAGKLEQAKDKLMFIPAPVGTKEASYCLDLTCIGIFSETEHPEEAYDLWEYLVANEYSVSKRAEIGLGIPASKDYFSYLPYETDFDKQTLDVVSNYQLKNLDLSPKICPYISYTSLTAQFDKYYLPVLYERDTLANALKTINSETEILIEEGKDLVGVE